MCYQGWYGLIASYTLLITESEKVGKFTWYDTRESDMEGLELIRISNNFFFFFKKANRTFSSHEDGWKPNLSLTCWVERWLRHRSAVQALCSTVRPSRPGLLRPSARSRTLNSLRINEMVIYTTNV